MSLRQLDSKSSKPAPTGLPLVNPARAVKTLPLEQGLMQLRAKRYDAAIASLRVALRREPGRFAAARGLATAYLLGGKPKLARATLEAFTAEQPMAGEGWRLAAQLEWKLSDRARAIEILYAGLKRLPNSQMLHRQLAGFLAADGKFEAAAAHVREVPAGEEDSFKEPANQLQDAASLMARSKAPTLTVEKDGDHDWLDQIAADPVLLAAILAPHHPAEMVLTAESRQMLQNIEWKLGQLLEAQPNHADRQLLLARLQTRLDLVPQAMLSLQRAQRANPNLIEAHRLKAQLHARIGETDQAIDILRNLLKRGHSWPDIHFEIAGYERQRGCDSEARSHLYSAIRINPKFEQAKELLDRMAA